MAPAPFQFQGNAPPKGPAKDRNRGAPRGRPSRPRQQFTFRYPKPPTSERPLLRTKREVTPEQLTSVDQKPGFKFASLDALSDSEEAEMDFSEDSDDENRPRKKRAVGFDGQESPKTTPLATAPTPKWSNPDPYTALPPPDQNGLHKRVDVVKLIRKARLDNNASKQNNAVAENHDFISLGAFEEPKETVEISNGKAPDNAPKGPKNMDIKESGATKRTRDDEPKGFSTKLGKPQRRYNSDGSILQSWRPYAQQDSSPWMLNMPKSALHLSTR